MSLCGLLRLDGADVRRSTLTAMLASSALGLPAVRGVHLDGPFGVVTAAGVAGDPVPPVAVDEGGLAVLVLGCGRPAARHLRVIGRPGTDDPRRLVAQAPGGPEKAHGPAAPGGTGAPGETEPARAAGRADESDDVAIARRVAVAYREGGGRRLRGLPSDQLVLVWDPAARQLLVTRTGRHAVELLTWSDGRQVAFATEQAQLTAVFQAPPAGPRARPDDLGSRLRDARGADAAGAAPAAEVWLAQASGAPLRAFVGGGRARRLAPGERISISATSARRSPRPTGASGLRLVPRPTDAPEGLTRDGPTGTEHRPPAAADRLSEW